MNECPICLADITQFDCRHLTSCGHTFHKECIKLWGKDICPMCRHRIDVIIDLSVFNYDVSVIGNVYLFINDKDTVNDFMTKAEASAVYKNIKTVSCISDAEDIINYQLLNGRHTALVRVRLPQNYNHLKHRAFKELFINGRHLNITIIIELKDYQLSCLDSDIKMSIDYIFMNKCNTKQIYDNFGYILTGYLEQILSEYDMVVFNQNTEQYNYYLKTIKQYL